MATLFLMLIYLTFISLGLPDSLLGAAWPVMRLELGAPLDAAGYISIVIAGGTIISSLFSERIIKRFGTGKVTAVSVLATALALLGIVFVPNILFLVLLAVPLGLGAGAVDAALNNYVALHYKPRHMSWLHSFWGVGAFVGPLILGAFMGQNSNWRGGYQVIAIIQLAVSALLFLSLPQWKKREGLAAQATAEDIPKTAPGEGKVSVIRIPGVVPALLTFTCYCTIEMTTGIWGTSYLVEKRGFAEAAAATAISLYYMGITFGRFVSGFLTARFSGRKLIRAGGIGVLAAGVLLLLPLPTPMAYVGLFLLGLGCAPIYPSMIHETPRRFGAQHSQKIIGWQMASAYCGSTFAPPIIGFIGARTSMLAMPIAVLVFAFVMLVLSERITLAVKKNRQTTEENA